MQEVLRIADEILKLVQVCVLMGSQNLIANVGRNLSS